MATGGLGAAATIGALYLVADCSDGGDSPGLCSSVGSALMAIAALSVLVSGGYVYSALDGYDNCGVEEVETPPLGEP